MSLIDEAVTGTLERFDLAVDPGALVSRIMAVEELIDFDR